MAVHIKLVYPDDIDYLANIPIGGSEKPQGNAHIILSDDIDQETLIYAFGLNKLDWLNNRTAQTTIMRLRNAYYMFPVEDYVERMQAVFMTNISNVFLLTALLLSWAEAHPLATWRVEVY